MARRLLRCAYAQALGAAEKQWSPLPITIAKLLQQEQQQWRPSEANSMPVSIAQLLQQQCRASEEDAHPVGIAEAKMLEGQQFWRASEASSVPSTTAKLLQPQGRASKSNVPAITELNLLQQQWRATESLHAKKGRHECELEDLAHTSNFRGTVSKHRPSSLEAHLQGGPKMCHFHQAHFGSWVTPYPSPPSSKTPHQAAGRGWTRPYSSSSSESSSSNWENVAKEGLFLKQPSATYSSKLGAGEDKLKKVTVVGVGSVGMACVQTIVTQNLCDSIALVDLDPSKLRGELLDLRDGAAFMPTVSIEGDVDYKVTANSDICIITAGARHREGEDRLSLVDRNVQVFKGIIPKLVEHSPETIFLVVSNPVDILTWVAWKLSGFPPNRVVGTGTNLDSSRFRTLLAQHFQVSVENVHAHILGEHGGSCVPIWSSALVAGVPVAPLLGEGKPRDRELLKGAHGAVVEGAFEVIKLKGCTSWAIGYSAAGLVSSMLRNQRRVHPVSIMSQGFHGIEQEVYLSLPAMLGRMGVHSVVNSQLDDEEV